MEKYFLAKSYKIDTIEVVYFDKRFFLLISKWLCKGYRLFTQDTIQIDIIFITVIVNPMIKREKEYCTFQMSDLESIVARLYGQACKT